MYKGIDVSERQGTIDWKKVKKAGCRFAVLRSINRTVSFEKKSKTVMQMIFLVLFTVILMPSYLRRRWRRRNR